MLITLNPILTPIIRKIAVKIKFKLDGVKSFQSNLDKLKAFGEQDDVMSGCSGSTCASVASAKVTE